MGEARFFKTGFVVESKLELNYFSYFVCGNIVR